MRKTRYLGEKLEALIARVSPALKFWAVGTSLASCPSRPWSSVVSKVGGGWQAWCNWSRNVIVHLYFGERVKLKCFLLFSAKGTISNSWSSKSVWRRGQENQWFVLGILVFGVNFKHHDTHFWRSCNFWGFFLMCQFIFLHVVYTNQYIHWTG